LQIDFAVQVWRFFPDRLVGFFTRRLLSDGHLSSKLLNDFTFLTGAALVYDKSYNEKLNAKLHSLPDQKRLPCFDRLLNQLATANGKRPIKLTARYYTGKSAMDFVSDEDCFASGWNATLDLNMKSSRIRFDPLLYKDSVSNLRKKYRQMEMANAN
jgi:glucuronyl/N-acetylglucosaminyl transferase EXT1